MTPYHLIHLALPILHLQPNNVNCPALKLSPLLMQVLSCASPGAWTYDIKDAPRRSCPQGTLAHSGGDQSTAPGGAYTYYPARPPELESTTSGMPHANRVPRDPPHDAFWML